MATYFSKRSKELGNDSHDLLSYFKSLLPDIRKLPPHEVHLCEIKFLQIINELCELIFINLLLITVWVHFSLKNLRK